MNTYTPEYCERVVLHWIGRRGISRNKLRCKRPRLAEWQRFEEALDRLIASGAVLAERANKRPGSKGRAATKYVRAR